MNKTVYPAFSFMAVAKGVESSEPQVKRYKGIAALDLLAVNPTRKELDAIYGSSRENAEEPKYIGTGKVKDKNGIEQEVPQVRFNFIMKTDPNISCNNGIDATFSVNIFVNKAYSFSTKEGVTRVQVIDRFGRTAWATEEELKSGAIPEYTIRKGEKAGQKIKANISEGYHACYVGEDQLVQFIIAHNAIPAPTVWDPDQRVYYMRPAEELKLSECMLDNIKKYFDGDIYEVKEALAFRPKNKMKLLFGIRTASNGTQYQCVYTRMPMKLSVMNYSFLEKELLEDKNAGRHPSEDYEVCTLKEVSLQPTNYSKKEATGVEEDPFASSSSNTATPASMPMDLPEDNGDPFAA